MVYFSQNLVATNPSRRSDLIYIQIQIQIQGIYTLQAHLDEDRTLPDTVLHNPDIAVPQGVDLGHLTEAADHGQVNHRQNSLKILDQNSNHLGESEQGLDEAVPLLDAEPLLAVGPLLAGGVDPGEVGAGGSGPTRESLNQAVPEPPEDGLAAVPGFTAV